MWMTSPMNIRMNIDKAAMAMIKPGVVINADWPAADNIHAFCTTRNTGVSQGTFSSFNLAQHVEDRRLDVQLNREQLVRQFKLPAEPVWLEQVHGRQVINAAEINSKTPRADASFSDQAGKICAVMTADCLPLLICNRQANKVAAIHAGWRGMAAGIIEATVTELNEKPDQLLVWLGPAIGPQAFEVGQEVREVFINDQAESEVAFKQNRPQHYLADIYQLAKLRLQRIGINAVYGGDYCTFTDTNNFYSYRREGKTGRQASLIWFE